MKAMRLAIVVLLAGASLVTSAAEPRWICFGNEPSWSLRWQDEQRATFATPAAPSTEFVGSTTHRRFARERMWRGRAADRGEVVAFIAERNCSDGMSDTRHPAQVRVSLPDGRFLAGCCRTIGVAATEVPEREVAMQAPEGVGWIVIGYDNGQGRLVDPIEGTTLSLAFDAGRLSGHAGCNALRATYTREGTRLAIGPLISTRKACVREGVMAQEQAFLAALRRVAMSRIAADGRLELADPGGAPLVRASPAAR